MLLIAHISIATVMSSLALLLHADKKLQTATIFTTVGTVLSGAALVVIQNASLVHVCLSGALLAGFACVSIALSRSKLATQKSY